MSLKFVSSILTTRCQALFGQSAAHRSTINFQVPRMCSVKLHSTQFNRPTCYHSNDNVSVFTGVLRETPKLFPSNERLPKEGRASASQWTVAGSC